ncbi:MAG: hypothetical protein D6781_10615 [Verrucomicrobia bacterium]|nr:MAG: hypothetical protein D6781_10615 [Verrucomicrobiota bacterium]
MSDDRTAWEIIKDFVLERAASEPVAKRALLYRALAAEAPGDERQRLLTAAADALEQADRRAGQLLLQLPAVSEADGREGSPQRNSLKFP